VASIRLHTQSLVISAKRCPIIRVEEPVHLAPHNHHSWTTSCSSVADLLDPALPLEHEGYDAVTAVSSLHPMPLQPALGRLAGLVRLAESSWP